MAEFDLTQAEADMLIAVEKHGVDDTPVDFPGPGERVAIPLTSADHREHFVLDVVRASEAYKGDVSKPGTQYSNFA